MKRFLDTNVLIYAVDTRDEIKRAKAISIIEAALLGYSPSAISVQTLSEFANVALSKIKLSLDEVMGFVASYQDIPTVIPDSDLVLRGLEIKRRYQLQFYDALMVSAAERAGCDEIYTEDLNDGQLYCGVKAVNPFK